MLRTELIKPLPDLLKAHAHSFGNKTAFSDGRRSVSYAELEKRTARLAGHLAALRLQPGDRAAILLGNRVETVESYIAIVRAAAIGVPLNPRSTDAELDYLLQDSGARVVITDAAHLEQVRALAADGRPLRIVVVGEEGAGGASVAGTVGYERLAGTDPAEPPRDDLALDDVAWILYTSGTTGKPKGVRSTQRNCLWSVAACYVPVPGLSAADRVLWPLPLFHSLSHIFCVLAVTSVGASARIVDGFSAEEILRGLEEDGTTFLGGVPTMYHYLVQAARERGFRAPALRMCLVGGAITTASLRQAFEESFGAPLLDAYGSTETCGSITVNWPTGARVEGSCGLPVPGLNVRLVDPETGAEVGTDEEGEVWVSGPNVMAGYHNKPVETAAALVDGWYRTGDLARRDSAGYFTVTGRIKELIIRGGENIHPGEVEQVLREVPGVADCAVVGKPHDVLGEVPVAFLVPGPEGVDPERVFTACRERLAYYKVPEELYEIEEVPRTQSGKITRHALLARPGRLRAAGSGRFEALLRCDWVPLPAPAASAPGTPAAPAAGPWAVIGTDPEPYGGTGYDDPAALAAAVAAGAAAPEVTVLAVDRIVAAAAAGSARPTGETVERAVRAVADTVGAWLAGAGPVPGRLVVVTRQAVATGGDTDAPDLAHAAVRGHLEALRHHHPGRVVLADTDTETAPGALARALRAALGSAEDRFAVRDGVLLGARLARVSAAVDEVPRPLVDPRRTVLVTGVAGARGAAAARHLVAAHRARHLLLISEQGEDDPAAEALRAELAGLGAEVALHACDLTDREALAGLLSGAEFPVGTVVHAPDPEDTWAAGPLRAAADAALNLHELTRAAQPVAFVLFSAADALLGLPADPAQAAADAFAQALAQHRTARGLAARTLAWGPWQPAGSRAADEALPAGIGVLPAHTALAMFDAAQFASATVLFPVKLDTATLHGDAVPALFADLVDTAPRAGAADDTRAAALRERLGTLRDDGGVRMLLELVRTEAARTAGLDGPGAVGSRRDFKALGFTSVQAVELRNRLTEATGLPLPATLAFDHPTPDAVARYLRSLLLREERPTGTVTAAARAADADEPVAIVAMSCRLPGGVTSPQELWRLVEEGVDAVSAFPDDRGWNLAELYDPDPAHTGTSYVREGGFLYDAGEFDAGFFGISPREALASDPQQRILLETAWETFERAGIDPVSLRGSSVGVFAGVMYHDYGSGLTGVPEGIEGQFGIGTAGSVVSGRVSYTLGLEGPAVTIDTACSSSLVALHLAAQAVRGGECSMALAGGVAVMATPSSFVEFSRQQGLASDGRCKAFAAAADGTGWSEGVGLVLLERLSDARRNGHQVLAVIRGSAINQDGASNGLTAPSGPAQQRVIRQALANAGLTTADVDAVEAHGTGTRLGDPIEAQAVIATYGQDRPADQPLWLGSLKSNIGHAQSAAGVAGVIKMVEAIRHGVLPRTLHIDEPTPHVDWSAGAVELLTEARPWPDTGRPRRAAVSSFGVSGTNAHVIVEQPPVEDVPEPADDGPEPPLAAWTLSAATAEALPAQAARLSAFLAERPELDVREVGFALATARAHLDHRAVLTAADRDSALAELRALAQGRTGTATVTDQPSEGALAVLFTGQGAQRAGMGRELYDAYPAFADAYDTVCAELDKHLDHPLADVIASGDGLDDTGWTQPALFALEVALYRLFESWGLRPDHLAGHSVGEITAAHIAGILTLEDAATLVTARGRLMQALPPGGAMLAVNTTETDIQQYLDTDDVTIAAVNGPTSIVLSGTEASITAIARRATDAGLRTKQLTVSHAFHSPLMDPMLEDFRTVLGTLTFHTPTIPLVSTLTGTHADHDILTPDYWVDHARQAVRFADAIHTLHRGGTTTYLELGPDAALTPMTGQTLDNDTTSLVTPALRRNQSEVRTAALALAALHTRGVPVDWRAFFGVAEGRGTVELPTYAFQRQRYWLDGSDRTGVPRDGRGTDTDDSRFWDAVESGDLDALGATLGSDDSASLGAALPILADWRRGERLRGTLDSWTYRVTWKRLAKDTGAHPNGTWLAVVPAGAAAGQSAAILDGLRAQGAEFTVYEAGTDPEAYGPALRAALAEAGGIRGVLSLLALDTRPHPEHPAVTRGLAALAHLLPALAESGTEARVWSLTQGAVTGSPDGVVEDPAQALVWGFGVAAALEFPRLWGGLVDVPAAGGLDRRALRRLAVALGGPRGEDQLAVRASGIFARRLTRAPRHGAAGDWSPRGTVLITGGSGGVGARIARRLARAGAGHLLLSSRRGPAAEGAAELVAELRESGAEATVVACDTADRSSVAALLDAVPADRPLTAVVHAAGVGQFTSVADTTVPEMDRILAGKVLGATHLDELLGDQPLDAFVLISSSAGVWGGGGQSTYAAANAYLDALAERRHALGRTATSVAWGSWGGAGMGAADGAAERMRRLGVPPMDPEPATAALLRAVGRGETTVVVADVEWSRFAPGFTAARPSALLGELPEVAEALREDPAPTTGGGAGGSFAQRVAALAEGERAALVLESVCEAAAAVLGHDSGAAITADRSFKELGFDSMTAVELRNRLGATTGVRLPATLAFDHPTPQRLADHLLAEVTGTTTAVAPVAAARAALDDDPIAIVSMAGRFPDGLDSPEELWRLLAEGRDAISGFPADRGWDIEGLYDPEPGTPGRTYSLKGGFLRGADRFDAAFFGISPREALAMDPQQRVILETAWETFERGGIDVHGLRGSRTGVFVGAFHTGYAIGADQEEIEGYTATGNQPSVLSGRVAYTFGFEGPAVTVDTACSSSLVALHLAAKAVRDGECELALAGGVTVLATPDGFVEFSRQRGLAVDGRCKAFAAAADGTGWSEAAGLLLVERLSDARRNGHRVLGLLRGSAVNQDGASNGLTAPNGPSQQRVIRQALADAGLSPADVDLVEAHGTGTRLGDPIEAQAVLAAYGQDRPDGRPLWLGSAKSNIGHTQAAAGVTGIIKVIMAMRHGVMPKTLHIDEPTPHVDWSAGAVELLTEARPWPETGRPRRAAVSSFGVSGTNAHVVIEEPPAEDFMEPAGEEPGLPVLDWQLSARTPQALRAQAERLLAFVREPDAPGLRDTALALARRPALEHRAVVVGTDRDSLVSGLAALAAGTAAAGTVTGAEGHRKLAVLFTGQGAQRAGMGRELYDAYPAFADAYDTVCAELDKHLDHPLADVIASGDGLDDTGWTQPALFALEVALYRLFESWGVRPDHLAGHSVGEISAAHIAGILTLEDAATLVTARGRLMQALPPGGTMLAVNTTETDIQQYLDTDDVTIAAVNGPTSIVLSGTEQAVTAVAQRATDAGLRTKQLTVSHAFHSPLMDPMLEDFRTTLDTLTFHTPTIPLVSTLTGTHAGPDILTPDYWVDHARQAVRFADAIHTLHRGGTTTYLELGPDAALTPMTGQTLDDDTTSLVTPALRRNQSEVRTAALALAALHTRGVPVDRTALLDAEQPGAAAQLPTYAFQRERYWLEPAAPAGDAGSMGLVAAGHPLLGAVSVLPESGGVLATGRLSLATHPWLADHTIAGTVLLPGTALVEMAVRAGDEVGSPCLEELIVEAPLVVPAKGGVHVQVVVSGEDATGRRALGVYSRSDAATADTPWTRHAGGALTAAPGEVAGQLTVWPPAGAEQVAVDGFYERLATGGFAFGPLFQGLRKVWTRGEEVFAEVVLDGADRAPAAAFGLHPGLLDSALHAAAFAPSRAGDERTRLPFAWNGVVLHATGAGALRVRIAPAGADGFSVTAADPTGAPVASVASLVYREVAAEQLGGTGAARDALFRVDWMPVALSSTPRPADWRELDVTAEPEGSSVPEQVRTLTGRVLAAVQEFVEDAEPGSGPLVVTARSGHPATAAVRGLLRTAQLEHPDRIVLAELDGTAESRKALAAAVATGEPQFRLSEGALSVPRLVRHTPPAEPATPVFTGTVLITGGTGSLGSLIARHLVTHHHVTSLLLTNRSGPHTDQARHLTTELHTLGATDITITACDTTDRDALETLLHHHPVTAVIHTAGTLDDGTLTSLTPDRLTTVLAPKADGAWHLHELTTHHHLDAFVLFSSISGTLGNPGQANYSAANAFLDELATLRHHQGQPATSLAWGLWEQTDGMAGSLEDGERRRATRSGMRALTPEEGLALLDAALTDPHPTLVPARLDLAAYARHTPTPALLHHLVKPTRKQAGAAATGTESFADRLAGLGAGERAAALLDLVRAEAAAALGHAGADAVQPDQAFKNLGFDSLAAVELRNRLTTATGVKLPATLVFDHPTPQALAGRLAEELAVEPEGPEPTVAEVLAELDRLERALAVAALDPAQQGELGRRLHSLTARWGQAVPAEDDASGLDLDAASDDELFDLIDSELGL
nr:type I pks [Streptomyces sp.]